MRTIWKFALKPGDNVFELSAMDKVLDVQIQNGEPCMWVFIHNTEALKIERKFKVYGTGHQILEAPHRLDHVSTFQMNRMVWHVFEIKE